MDQIKKMEKLLRDYGYPEEAIPRLIREISSMNYDRVRKLILPYNDITAGKIISTDCRKHNLIM
ncbi:hypothetical protein QFZ28_005624 [Neobacillus niacini]|uniref:hypothetical protein n=1 Tax=Neobacillus niacini TaxID=86668 RepID=UPI002786CBC6|nr:hypothetical protein [Neobacillus niacini]MDQ1005046.1 hypothetical protein [Neobacillus niacini]